MFSLKWIVGYKIFVGPTIAWTFVSRKKYSEGLEKAMNTGITLLRSSAFLPELRIVSNNL